ncbi:MAG: DUF3006 domain-containing protein [Bacilli bacterium]|nr:DUF3006 domain-containing protein [Bacilli bacterium]
MKYSVDRIEEDIAILENIETGEIVEINKNELEEDIKESDILIFKDNKYIKDDEEKEDRLKSLEEKFNLIKGE